MSKNLTHSFSTIDFLKRFMVFLWPMVLVFALVLYLLDAAQMKSLKSYLLEKEAVRIEEIANLARKDVGSALPAIYEIAGSHHLRRYLDQNSSYELDELASELLGVARLQTGYDQIRYLDEHGLEIVRVNSQGGYPKLVERASLQDKSGRDYFKALMRLQPGEFYVSEINLNRENGQVELPVKPTVRIGVPVFDHTGKWRGAVVINLLYGEFLESIAIRNTLHPEDGELMVLSPRGYWLAGGANEDNFAFDLGKPTRSFARDHQKVWQTISTQESGIQSDAYATYVYTTVHLPHAADQITSTHLKVVSQITPKILAEGSLAKQHPVWVSAFFLLLVVITALLVTNMLSRERVVTILKAKNLQLGDKTMRLHSILDGTRVGTWEWNVQTGETVFNAYWAEMLGYTLEELAPVSIETWKRLTHPEDMEKSLALLEKHFAGKLPYYECELRMRHRLGHWIWVLDRGRVTHWLPDGKPSMMFGTHQDVSQRKLVEDEMQRLAHHDLLTGLPNRVLLEDRLQQTLASAQREHSRFALLFIDLDEFKPVNDNYGHAIGDEVLKGAARRIMECMRASDTAARVGGDEFVAILPRIQQGGDAVAVAAKVRRALAEPFLIEGLSVKISTSIGIAIYPDDGEHEEILLERADQAMYQAKQNGRNQVRLFHV
jgi:diguanylate cyclase (GGDEF)-like protein/PAS domain S-box-containing protein